MLFSCLYKTNTCSIYPLHFTGNRIESIFIHAMEKIEHCRVAIYLFFLHIISAQSTVVIIASSASAIVVAYVGLTEIIL